MKVNKDTLLYGSFSSNPGNNGNIFFNEAFEKYNINAIYKSFYSTDVGNLVISVKHLNFSGFALSMPLKVDIIKYLDYIDESARNIGAVNTVINVNGKLTGYNTDWIGVYNYISKYHKDIKHMHILGNGGFSKAVQYALEKLGIEYNIITRKDWYKIPLLDGYFFNATPIDIEVKGILIDGRPFTDDGKEIAKLQAIEQFYLYTNIKYDL